MDHTGLTEQAASQFGTIAGSINPAAVAVHAKVGFAPAGEYNTTYAPDTSVAQEHTHSANVIG